MLAIELGSIFDKLDEFPSLQSIVFYILLNVVRGKAKFNFYSSRAFFVVDSLTGEIWLNCYTLDDEQGQSLLGFALVLALVIGFLLLAWVIVGAPKIELGQRIISALNGVGQ